jgi:hypothetical protein
MRDDVGHRHRTPVRERVMRSITRYGVMHRRNALHYVFADRHEVPVSANAMHYFHRTVTSIVLARTFTRECGALCMTRYSAMKVMCRCGAVIVRHPYALTSKRITSIVLYRIQYVAYGTMEAMRYDVGAYG